MRGQERGRSELRGGEVIINIIECCFCIECVQLSLMSRVRPKRFVVSIVLVRLSLETKFTGSQQKQQDSINEKCPENVHANNLGESDRIKEQTSENEREDDAQ